MRIAPAGTPQYQAQSLQLPPMMLKNSIEGPLKPKNKLPCHSVRAAIYYMKMSGCGSVPINFTYKEKKKGSGPDLIQRLESANLHSRTMSLVVLFRH